MLTIFLLALNCAWAQTTAPASPERIDRVIVVVGTEVITASDLQLSIALDERDTPPIGLDSALAEDSLERLIDRAILRGLAGKVGVYQPYEADVRSRLDALKTTWADISDYKRFLMLNGLNEARLLKRISQRMITERYIRRNLPNLDRAEAGTEKEEAQAWMGKLRGSVTIRYVHKAEAPK